MQKDCLEEILQIISTFKSRRTKNLNKMNYKIEHDGEIYYYPSKTKLIGSSELKFPTFPYERDYHNENTRKDESKVSDFKLIQICPKFRSRDRLIHVIDRFFIADKICQSSKLPIQSVLYCKSIWPTPNIPTGDYGEFYSGMSHLEYPERLLWHSYGWWEVNFVWKVLPKEWQYDSGSFSNRFETFEEAIKSISEYIKFS